MDSRITEEALIRRIIEKVKGGTPPDVASRACGVTIHTFKNWMKRGEDEESGPYADFYNKLSQADAENEEALAIQFRQAAYGDWKANEAYMSRRWPQRWGKPEKNTLQIGRLEEDPAVSVIVQLDNPTTRKALADLYGALSGLKPTPTPDLPEIQAPHEAENEPNTVEGTLIHKEQLHDDTPNS